MDYKKPIKKKEFLSERLKQERMQRERVRERIERQNEILKNRSEGLKEWTKKHGSAEMIFDLVMNALDYVPPEHKKIIVNFLKMPIFEYNHNHSDYLAYENDIDDMDAVFEMIREIHDVSAQELGLKSYKEDSDNFYKEVKKERAKRRRKVKEETVGTDEPYDIKASEEVRDDGLPF